MELDLYRLVLVLGGLLTAGALIYECGAVRDALRDTRLLRQEHINGSAKATAHTNLRNELRRAAEHLCLGVVTVVVWFAVSKHPMPLNFIGRGALLVTQGLVLANSRAARNLRRYVVRRDLAGRGGISRDD